MPFPERIGPTELGITIATLSTINRPMRLTSVVLVNRTAAERTITLHLVPSGAAAADANKLADVMPIIANDLRVIDFGWTGVPLAAGDLLRGFADAAGVIFIATVYDEKPR